MNRAVLIGFGIAGVALLLGRRRDVVNEVEALARVITSEANGYPAIVTSLRKATVVRDEDLLRLARLGFQDAISSHQINALARRQGGLVSDEAQEVLRVAEGVASLPGHAAAPGACMRLGLVYGTAIWVSWHPPTPNPFVPLDDDTRHGLTSALLDRAEARDLAAPTEYSLLDELLRVIFRYALLLPRASFEPAGDETVRLSLGTPSGTLWSFVVHWAGQQRQRRMAFARAFCESLIDLDKRSGEDGPDFTRVAPLILAFLAGLPARPGDLMLSPEGAALAVVSACWAERPLQKQSLEIRRTGQQEAVRSDLETILQETAKELEQEHPDVAGNEGAWIVRKALGELPVSPEALLLRLSPEKVAGLARGLADQQGIHDGRAYVRLHEFATAPEDAELRRRIAREAIRAPWRLFRGDPLIIRRWGHDANVFPRNIEELRELLSEPGPLPEDPGFLPARIGENGAWRPSQRTDFADLARQASEIPGVFAIAPTPWRLDQDVYAVEVESALARLRTSSQQPAARVEADMFFLLAGALSAPEVDLSSGKVDLRTELMPVFESVLADVTSEPPQTALAAVEAALLRISSATVEVLAQNSRTAFLSIPDGLWLTYRLYQWLVMQIDTLDANSRDDALAKLSATAPPAVPAGAGVRAVLNPARFGRDRFDHRLGSVLFVLANTDSYLRANLGTAAATASRSQLSWATLTDRLLALAGRDLTEEESQLRDPSGGVADFGWRGAPATVPDLALLALLSHDPAAFVRIDERIRLRLLTELAGQPPTDPGARMTLIPRLITTAATSVAALSASERDQLHAIAHNPQVSSPIRALTLISLYGAGDLALADEVAALVSEHLSHATGNELFGRYAIALVSVAPERFDGELERLLGKLESDGGPAIEYLTALGRVASALETGPLRSAVGALILRLVERPPYQANPELVQLASVLVPSEKKNEG